MEEIINVQIYNGTEHNQEGTFSPNFQTDSGAHPASYLINIRVPSQRYSGCDLTLTIYLHQVPMLRMVAVIPLLLPYGCMARTGTLFSH